MATTVDKVDDRQDFGVRRIMVWTAAREEKLLALWKSRRCLFDPNSLVSRSERQQALAEVAAEIGIAEEDLMKHMASLRTQYCRCMKSGSAIATTHRQRWLVRKLSFLKPYIKKRLRATSDFDAAHYNRQFNQAAYDQLIGLQEALSGDVDSEAASAAVVDDVEHSASIDLELMAADETVEGDDDGQSVQSVHARDGGDVEWLDVVGQESTSTSTLTAAGGRRQVRACLDDDDAVFGQLIVRELRHISDPETKLLLRHNILTMIFETRLGCLQWARGGGGHHPARPPLPSLRRLDQRERRPPTLSTINGCWSSPRRAHTTHDDADSADAVVSRQNRTVADDGQIVIKEETE